MTFWTWSVIDSCLKRRETRGQRETDGHSCRTHRWSSRALPSPAHTDSCWGPRSGRAHTSQHSELQRKRERERLLRFQAFNKESSKHTHTHTDPSTEITAALNPALHNSALNIRYLRSASDCRICFTRGRIGQDIVLSNKLQC